MTRIRGWWLLVLLVAATGCAAVGKQMTAGVEDYAAYRRMRTAPTVEQKLQASQAYLRDQPRGRWRREVTRWLRGADRAYFRRAYDHEARLREYLRILPAGPHADRVRLRLDEFEQERRNARRRKREFDRSVERYERQLARAQADRKALVATFLRFVRHLTQTAAWGQPTWELEPRFLADWRHRPPAARCRLGRCVKTVTRSYSIPEYREIAPRLALFDVVVQLQRGLVSRVELVGPELFSRIGEAVLLRPTPPGDVMARAVAIAEVLALMEPVIDDVFPADRCPGQAVSPVILLRECDGKRLRIEAPPAPAEDAIIIEPVARGTPTVASSQPEVPVPQ